MDKYGSVEHIIEFKIKGYSSWQSGKFENFYFPSHLSIRNILGQVTHYDVINAVLFFQGIL